MHDRWQALFGNYLNSSFLEVLRHHSPESVALPTSLPGEPGPVEALRTGVPHGTTILAIRYAEGVVVAGDRQATEGYQVAHRRIEKVYKADDYSAIAIAGAAGQAVELVKLFQLELEHYEKITGDRLSLEGKANRLAQMIRSNFPMALQGFVVVPLFGGYDERRDEGRIFYYDATGGRWEEDDYQTNGSGSLPAKNSLKKRWRPGLSRDEALRVAAEALIDAADDDSATGGPDPARGIYPVMIVVTADGAAEIAEDDVRAAVDAVLAERGGAS
jgi:proteasome beta subunit